MLLLTIKNKLYKWCCALALLVQAAVVDSANIGTEPIVNLSITDGLASETVNRILSDHSGQVWIATTNGVNLYNGKSLVAFRLSDASHRMVVVKDLCETSDKSIYAATEFGLYRLEYGKHDFEKILPEVAQPSCLLSVGDTLYIGGMQGIQIYDGQTLKTVQVGASPNGIDNIVRKFFTDSEGRLWYLGRYDFGCYHMDSGKVQHFSLSGYLPDQTPLRSAVMAGNRVFVGTISKGLYVLDTISKTSQRLEMMGNVIMDVSLSADGYVCVATDGVGAFRLDPQTLQVVDHFTADGDDWHRLPTNAIYTYHRDAGGVNWFGMTRYGLAYTTYCGSLFRPYAADGFSTLGLNVRSFLLRGSESLIGLQDGLWYVDSTRHVRRYFSGDELGGHIVNNIVWWQGEYYIGTYDGGLRVLNPLTLSLRRHAEAPLLGHSGIGDVEVGPDGNLWVGCDAGLFIITAGGEVTRYTEQNSHIVGGLIIDITFDRKGNAWLTAVGGLSLYSAASREVVNVDFPKDFFDKQVFLKGQQGHDSIIYMRNGPQLFYTTDDMREYGELPLPISLSDRWCRSMVDDMKGHLWLASERGLLRLGYQMDDLMLLGYGAGLQGRLISEVKILDDNRLAVATSSGLFAMDMNQLDAWQQTIGRKVRFCHIRKGSDLLRPTDEIVINEEREIRLSWNLTSEVLQMEAMLPDYSQQSGALYEYRLDKGGWQILQDGEAAALRGLMLGRHQLTVRLAGIESTASTYSIVVVPSLAAIIEALLLLAALVLLYFWYRYRKNTTVLLSERNEIEDALIAVEQELQESAESLPQPKYQKVKLDDDECEDIVSQMKKLVEEQRLYVKTDLRLKDLADMLHLSPSKLSQVFNIYMNENYYDFINRYRLDEFKRLIDAGEYKRYTVTALSEQSGFKKSNFFSTFRKVEGMTPVEYLKKKGVKI